MADSPARETPEEIIRILRCSDEDFANILDKNNVIILTCGLPKYQKKKTHNAVIRQSEYQPGNVFVIGDKSQQDIRKYELSSCLLSS